MQQGFPRGARVRMDGAGENETYSAEGTGSFHVHDVGETWRNKNRPFWKDLVDSASGKVLSRVFCAQQQHQPNTRKVDGTEWKALKLVDRDKTLAKETFSQAVSAKKRAADGEECKRSCGSSGTTYVTSLDRALAWRANLQHEHERPFLVLAHEKPRVDYAETRRTVRVYEVVCPRLFFARYANRRKLAMLGHEGDAMLQSPVAWDRFTCEVLAGPCKLFFDLEFYTAYNKTLDGEELQRALLSACAERLQREFSPPVACTGTVVLDSSKPGKFSRHVIVTLDGGETVFGDARDVARFLRGFPEDSFSVAGPGGKSVSFFDFSVYNGRQPFRLYGAGKYNEPNRLMRLKSEPAWESWETRDPVSGTLRESMVTHHGDTLLRPERVRVLQIPSPLTAGSPKKKVQCLEVPSGPAGDEGQSGPDDDAKLHEKRRLLLQLLQGDCSVAEQDTLPQVLLQVLFAVPEIAACDPVSAVHKPQSHAAFISCRGRYCRMAGRYHRSNTAYVHVDLTRATFRVRCHSPNCARAKLLPWQTLPHACKTLLNDFLAAQNGHSSGAAPVAQARMGKEGSEFLLS